MRGLLDPDNPVFYSIRKIVYSVYLNLLWLLCCLPVVTAGASTTALFYTAMRLARNQDALVTRSFFHSFRQNLKQATVLWGILFCLGAFLAVDGYVVYHLVYENAFWTVIAALLIAAALIYLTVLMYSFPLLACFENTVVATLKNALAMGLRYLFCTILMALIYFVMAFVIINVFTPAIVFGMGTCAYLCSCLLVKVFPKEDAGAEEV